MPRLRRCNYFGMFSQRFRVCVATFPQGLKPIDVATLVSGLKLRPPTRGWRGELAATGGGSCASCCGTAYPTSGRSLTVKWMLAPAFSITYNGTCDGKLLAFFLSYYEQHIA